MTFQGDKKEGRWLLAEDVPVKIGLHFTTIHVHG